MGCDSEIATQKDRPAECSVTFQLHRGGSIDLTGSLAAWRGSVLLQALVLAVLGAQRAPRLLQGFNCLLLFEMNGLPESWHEAQCSPQCPKTNKSCSASLQKTATQCQESCSRE